MFLEGAMLHFWENYFGSPSDLLGKEFFMNCKFHPTAEAVTTCATCGAGMCSSCENGAFFYTKDDKPLCLECSLKEAEEKLADIKYFQKETWIKGSIASVIWFAGLALGTRYEILYLLVLAAAIFFSGKALFTSEEKGFFEKIKAIFWQVILFSLFLPICVIYFLVSNKLRMIKTNSKVKKIKAVMGNTN